MTNIEKSEKFALISDENANQAIILPVGQLSFKITLPCGCSQVQHPLEMLCGLDFLTGADSVRACINNNKENYSIDVSIYNPEDHLNETATKQRDQAQIIIEMPKGLIWSGNISELQSILSSHCK